MTTDGWITLAITAAALAALTRDLAPDLVFMAAAVALTLTGVVTPAEAFAGFSNVGVLTVGALFVVAAALTETGVMGHVGEWFLGRVATERAGLARLAALVVPLSAVLNNTPIVAMLIPVVIDWCRKREISPSRLLMPLSFLTILGGTCSLIGTSTNLVVQGLAIKTGLRPMGLFEIGYAGVPCAICGVAYLLTVGRRLLPDRKELLEQLGETAPRVRRRDARAARLPPGRPDGRGRRPAAAARAVPRRDRPRRGSSSPRSAPTRRSARPTGWFSPASSARSSAWRRSRAWSRRPTPPTRSPPGCGAAGSSARRSSAPARR